jgi:hypothetical protein
LLNFLAVVPLAFNSLCLVLAQFAIQKLAESSEDDDVGEEMKKAVIQAVEELVRQLGSSTHLKHGTLYLFSLLMCYFIG